MYLKTAVFVQVTRMADSWRLDEDISCWGNLKYSLWSLIHITACYPKDRSLFVALGSPSACKKIGWSLTVVAPSAISSHSTVLQLLCLMAQSEVIHMPQMFSWTLISSVGIICSWSAWHPWAASALKQSWLVKVCKDILFLEHKFLVWSMMIT